MLDSLIKAMVEQGREASLVLYLLASLVFLGVALWREWLYLGKPTKKALDTCAAQTESDAKTLAAVNEKLVDQRILNERATGTISNLTDKVRQLELELARAEGTQWHRDQHRTKPERSR